MDCDAKDIVAHQESFLVSVIAGVLAHLAAASFATRHLVTKFNNSNTLVPLANYNLKIDMIFSNNSTRSKKVFGLCVKG